MYNSGIIDALKPLSSEEDKNFQSHFVHTKYLTRILTNDSDIIYGAKGNGKTALRIALTDINKERYFNTFTIDLKSLSFSAIFNKIFELHKIIKQELHLISSSVWKNTLLQYALFSLLESLEDCQLKAEIETSLTKCGFLKSNIHSASNNSNERVSNTIEKFFRKINSISLDDIDNIESKLSGTTAEQDNIINKFPFEDGMSNIINKLKTLLNESDKRVLICIDGLDSILNHTEESRNTIFNGLIDAIYFFRFDKDLSKVFSFKAFLPQELTLDTKSKIWDSDKHKHNTHYIRWNVPDLETFIQKRIISFSKKRYNKFNGTWTEFFPEKIMNSVYSVEENSFEYILRHTLYRPRQIQDHIFLIIQRWVEKTGGRDKISASFIPKIIAENNYSLAEEVAIQLSNNYPNIESFLLSWDNSPTYTNVSTFKERIRNYLITDREYNIQKINSIFDELYLFGIFGVALKGEEISFKNKTKNFHFAFAGDQKLNLIHHTTTDDEIIAFAPMFREYCGLKISNDFIINPISQNRYY